MLITAACVLLGIIYIFRIGFMEKGVQVKNLITNTVAATPTPFSFSELTIPFLRNKEYKGVLSSERAVSYETATYTAYTTSYTSDGLKINGLLTIPKGKTPDGGWPAIVFIHGYIPPSNYQTTQNYYDYVDYLARNGFVVFKIDLRGHGNSEGEPGGAYYSSDYIVDTLGAYNALENSGFVNARKIGLWGHSMAGNITSRAAAVKKDIPAVVIWGGAVYTYDDMKKYGIQDNSYMSSPPNAPRTSKRQELNNKYGQFNSQSEFWKQVPMTNYLDGIATAFQLNHAVNDDVVDVGYSRDLKDILDRAHITTELHEYPAGGHNINGSSFTSAMNNTVRFFKENLN